MESNSLYFYTLRNEHTQNFGQKLVPIVLGRVGRGGHDYMTYRTAT